MQTRARRLTPALALLVALSGCGGARPTHLLPTLPPAPPTPSVLGLVVTADEGGSLTVLGNAVRTVLRTIPLAGAPAALASSGDGTHVLVAVNSDQGARGSLVTVDVRTGEVGGSIALGTDLGLRDLAVTSTGTRALVLAEKTSELLTVDLTRGEVEARRAFTGETLRAIALVDDDRTLIAAGNAVLVVPVAGGESTRYDLSGPVVDVAARSGSVVAAVIAPPQLVRIPLASGRGAPSSPSAVTLVDALGPTAVALTPDGARAIVADGGKSSGPPGSGTLRVTLETGELGFFGRVGRSPRAVVVDGAGVVWVASRASGTVTILSQDGAFQLELPTGTHPVSITTVKGVQPSPSS